MVKNYLTNCLRILIGLVLLIVPETIFSQEPRIFTLEDFDLQGPVKTCLVITDYGKEEFEFSEDGNLIKSITRYNENDYDITYYRYQNTELSERRYESYREGIFDKNTSIAHFYSLDTTLNKKITEKILDYNKEFLDQYEYTYDEENRIVKIVRSNNQGLDETLVEYTNYKDEITKSYLMHGVIQKSVRSSAKKSKTGSEIRLELTKEFLDGQPVKAFEKVYDLKNRLVSEQNFEYIAIEKSFKPVLSNSYSYDDAGVLSKVKTNTNGRENVKEYIYQFDAEETSNWVKQIITPENAYTTRKIEYFDMEQPEEN